MSRSTQLYEMMMMVLWPLSKVAFRLGKAPLIGPLLKPIFHTQIHQAVMIPVNEAIRVSDSAPLPYALLKPMVEGASSRFIMDTCICRQNEGCSRYSHAIGCLYLGDGAAKINPSLGRLVNTEEALEHIRKAMRANLSPLIAHTVFDAYLLGIPFRRMLTVCFCCDCCCAIRHGLRMGPKAFWDIVVRLPGLTIEVSDDCIGCQTCEQVCPVQAIQMQEHRAAIGEQCKGCGHCAEACPMGAIHVSLEGDRSLGQLMDRINARTEIL